MFKIYLGEFNTGRLLRLPFIGYSLLLQLFVFVFVFAVILAIGAGEHLIGGDLQQAQNMLREWFTVPFFIIFGAFFALFIVAGLNLMAKRIRDIGLPGWWLILVMLIIESTVSLMISQEVSGGLHFFLTFLLLVIPSKTFAKS